MISVRGLGAFLAGLLIAILGTAVVDAPIYAIARPAMPRLLRMSYLLDLVTPLGLGYCIYKKWRLPQWQWVGAAGCGWFCLGVYRLLTAGSIAIYRDLSGLGCVYDRSLVGCTYYPLFTVLSFRAVSYSAGVLCCLGVGNYVRRRTARPM